MGDGGRRTVNGIFFCPEKGEGSGTSIRDIRKRGSFE